MKVELRPGERLDDLQIKGYKIIQDPGKFCFGLDAVLLANYASAGVGERVLDLGTGSGVIPILMEAKNEGTHYVGLEIQDETARMARRSVALNGLEEKIDIVTGDNKEASRLFGTASFSVVTANPPYLAESQGRKNEDESRYIARHEVMCTLHELLRESAVVLKRGGRFYMVHRPFRLTEILSEMHGAGIEPKRMRLVFPSADKEATLVLFAGVRGGRPGMTVEAPLILDEDNEQETGPVPNKD